MLRQVKRCGKKCLCSENGFLEKPTRAKTGKKGTTIISSHRDSHGIFIKKLQKGNIIKLEDRYKQWHTYQIDDFSIIDVSKYSISTLNTDDNLLIITCYPFNNIRSETPLRYVVSASQNLDTRTIN